ncbi:MAG: hypothetical protein V4658_08170, partial [Bacteroidota bacterium]
MIKKILISTLIFFVTLEAGLRIHGRYYTYTENNGDYYKSDYKKKFPTWYHHWTPNAVVDYKSAEFHYINHYNELGHREKPFSLFVADSTARKVVCIGDSFTEGDGTCYDSTWVRRLEQLTNVSSAELNEPSKEKTLFYNGGVCGSDVFFNNKMLQDKLVKANPVEVIECLNTSDINDVIWLGGNERFNADGTTSGKHAFWWDAFYHYSHVFRAFI